MSKEAMGAFIDAVYAIAITILALEIPSDFVGGFDVPRFLEVLLEYGVTFALLFAFWIQHRRINTLTERHTRGVLWLNALAMLLACLVPRATALIFSYGADVTVLDLEATLLHGRALSVATVVDMLFVAVVLFTDLSLLMLSRGVSIAGCADEEARSLQRNKLVASGLLFAVLSLSLLLPVQNRYFTLLLPLTLFFEEELALVFGTRLLGRLS